MDIAKLSDRFEVRKLSEQDVGQVLDLCAGNLLFYEYHPPIATKESILEDMSALPPNKDSCDKFYIGYFKGDFLVAAADLILDYPQAKIAYIGFFMVDISCQRKNIGTLIIEEMGCYLRALGFEKIRLAIDEGNPQSESFWSKNSFQKTGERIPNDFSAYLPMEQKLSDN